MQNDPQEWGTELPNGESDDAIYQLLSVSQSLGHRLVVTVADTGF